MRGPLTHDNPEELQRLRLRASILAAAMLAVAVATAAPAHDRDYDDGRRGDHGRRSPQVIVISLDGARPDIVEHFLNTGVLDRRTGLGRLRAHGVVARQNITITPSVTAAAHIAIATGSTAVNNDIPANTFHPVATTITTSISGFAAPIGGYQLSPLGPAPEPTAEPLWVRLRDAGKTVVTATWPGSDGADIRIAGTMVQPAEPTRITDYTVPFGAFGGLGAQGFQLTAASSRRPRRGSLAQLAAAGRTSFSPVKVTAAPVEQVFCAPPVAPPATPVACGTTNAGRTRRYHITAAALDTTNDSRSTTTRSCSSRRRAGIAPGPFARPPTGPAYAAAGRPLGPFFFEGSGAVVGAAFFVSHVAPDLSTVRFARYGANFIPRNASVLAVVDDVNTHVGFWRPQPDFRIPERLSPGFGPFPDLELEAMYLDQVETFTAYQTSLALHAIGRTPTPTWS